MDSDLGEIQVAMPEMIVQIHFLELVENQSHIRHQNVVRKLADGHALSSTTQANAALLGTKYHSGVLEDS